MKTANPIQSLGTSDTTFIRGDKLTRVLLTGGVIAGPLYIVIALIQGLTRPGFDLLHHDVSLLSNGDLGWIQITNFLVAGLLVMASAVGMRRAIPSGRGRVAGPMLLGIYGLGLIGAGIFVADPMNGFPPGTAANANTISWHGMLHIVSGGLGFLALIAGCFVFARRFAGLGKRGWAWYSVATGVIFLAAFAGVVSGSSQALIVVGFWIGVIIAWTWIALMSARLRAGISSTRARKRNSTKAQTVIGKDSAGLRRARKKTMGKLMLVDTNYTIINRNTLPNNGNTYEFEGLQYQNTQVSFIWVDMPPGGGVRLHQHPYKEIFIIQEGVATFTVGSAVLEAGAGQIIIVPADTPHKFSNRGDQQLRQVDIHDSRKFITHWLEE